VNGRIAAIAAQRGVAPAQVRQDLEKAGRINELALSIREQKVLDRILEKAVFTDVDAEAWNKHQTALVDADSKAAKSAEAKPAKSVEAKPASGKSKKA